MVKRSHPWLHYRANSEWFSFVLDRRVPPVVFALLFAAVLTLVIHISTGDYSLPLVDVFHAMLGRGSAASSSNFIVMELRLPRALVAWMVGAALGASGAIIQGLTRNPLASPDLTGVTAGASAAAVTLLIFFPQLPQTVLPAAAFIGGLLVAGLLYLFAWRIGRKSPLRLILIGIGLSAVFGAYTSFALTFGDLWRVQRAMMWLTGSVYATNWTDAITIATWLAAGTGLAMFLSRDLTVLNLGEDAAESLGMHVARKRGVLLAISVALAAVSVTVAGTIGFVGLIAPHIARKLVGPLQNGLLLVSTCTGGLFVILADMIGRNLHPPLEIPCGIVTSIIGVPFFLYIFYKKEKR